jgi:hypothetical protein
MARKKYKNEIYFTVERLIEKKERFFRQIVEIFLSFG